jgi:hypothetical protein
MGERGATAPSVMSYASTYDNEACAMRSSVPKMFMLCGQALRWTQAGRAVEHTIACASATHPPERKAPARAIMRLTIACYDGLGLGARSSMHSSAQVPSTLPSKRARSQPCSRQLNVKTDSVVVGYRQCTHLYKHYSPPGQETTLCSLLQHVRPITITTASASGIVASSSSQSPLASTSQCRHQRHHTPISSS